MAFFLKILNIKHLYIFGEANLDFGENCCHQFTMLISVALLQSKCVLCFRLVYKEQYQRSVNICFSNFLKKEV